MARTLADLAETALSFKIYLSEVHDPYSGNELGTSLASILGLIPPEEKANARSYKLYRVLGFDKDMLNPDSGKLVALSSKVHPEGFKCVADEVVSTLIRKGIDIPYVELKWHESLSPSCQSKVLASGQLGLISVDSRPSFDHACTWHHRVDTHGLGRGFRNLVLNWAGTFVNGQSVSNQNLFYTASVGPEDTFDMEVLCNDTGPRCKAVILNYEGGQTPGYRSDSPYFPELLWGKV